MIYFKYYRNVVRIILLHRSRCKYMQYSTEGHKIGSHSCVDWPIKSICLIKQSNRRCIFLTSRFSKSILRWGSWRHLTLDSFRFFSGYAIWACVHWRQINTRIQFNDRLQSVQTALKWKIQFYSLSGAQYSSNFGHKSGCLAFTSEAVGTWRSL